MAIANQTIAGYRVVEQLYDGSRTAVYRAVPGQSTALTPDSVVIKCLQQSHPTFDDLLHFRNQYTITKNLKIPGIVHPYGLANHHHSYALIMEDCGGISLRDYARRQHLTLAQILKIAIALAQILQDLHHNNIIHKDIKPANILIQPDRQTVKLIDFSIASLLPKETQTLQNPRGLEGTLAYLAPEQTGRMNRGIDYRADFYALGVTLYELVSGKLPFQSNDPMELIHCHIAKTPPSLAQLNLPEPVVAIVEKLMAKNAEDRYQSAWGLKHDLETCWAQWQESGEIRPFALGYRDQCDRFLIPEKLYGREPEVQALLNAFHRVALDPNGAELILVAGFSGIGKTAVVHEVHKPIVKQRGYFIKGKFDQFNRNLPFSAFVQAFRNLVAQLLSESSLQLKTWQRKIQRSLGENAQAVLEVLPELERLIGPQPPVPELTGAAAQARFNRLFQSLIQVFATLDHPLVIFLDDLQWVDSASLQLLELLMTGGETGHLLLIGAYRDNEVFPTHPLMLMLKALAQAQAAMETITLNPLSAQSLNELVADTLHCTPAVAQPLSQLIQQKTQGNPFFITQFLKALHQDRLIHFDRQTGYWQCDLTAIRGAILTDDVVVFMAQQLAKLPPETQGSLQLAACIGNQFDLGTLAIAAQRPQTEVAGSLWAALHDGLIVPQTQLYKFYLGEDPRELGDTEATVTYRFLHDRVQQAAYSLIPEAEKATRHYQIGQMLLAKIPPEEQEVRIFELVNQLNHGAALITTPTEREQLAALNLIACRKARAATAYEAGQTYAQMGLSLLGPEPWQREYDRCLAFHDLAVELAAMTGDFAQMEALIAAVLAQAHTPLARVSVYRVKIVALVAQNQPQAAIALARQCMESLGATLAPTADPETIQGEIAEIYQLIGDRPIADLALLPPMQQPETIAMVEIANSIMPAVFISEPGLFPLLVMFGVRCSIRLGNTAASAYSYACYGMIACTVLQDTETGVKFGELALDVVAQLEAKAVKPEVFSAVGLFLYHRKFHLSRTLPILQEAYTTALDVGDQSMVGYNAQNFCLNAFWAGQSLPALAETTRSYGDRLTQFHQFTTANWCHLYLQTVLNLLGETESPTELTGEAIAETTFLQQAQAAGDLFGLYFFHLDKLMLAYLFGAFSSAQHHGQEAQKVMMAAASTIGEPALYFYDALAILALASPCATLAPELAARLKTNQTQLQQWAHHAPMNHQHKVDLVLAEQCRVAGEKAEAIEYYEQAIAGANRHEYLQEEALASECAARFYLAWGKEKIAGVYMQSAYYSYARWGAKAKTDHLAETYPDLLRPILTPTAPSFNPLDTLATLVSPNFTAHTSSSTHHSSSSSLNTILDFAAIIKAAQALSSAIELEELLRQLTQIILQHSGGDRCLLLLPTGEDWQIRAVATPDQTEILTQPLMGFTEVPLELIHYVQNTQETIAINNLKTELPILGAYLSQTQPKSLLCLPLMNQGQLIGLLYLENRVASGVFSRDHLLVLNFLCIQAAIALENARLYQDVQVALNGLKQAQLQIIQSEKMASLGNLVAGVAHEVNNPVGFLNGSINNIKDYTQDILDHLALYEQYYGQSEPAVAEHGEEIELEFLREDLAKLLNSMQGAIHRIRSISDSLRTFSRADTQDKVTADIHAGLDSTLLILKYRLKANDKRPAIQVLKNYGEIPPIDCFLGQLNQVFMNLIANAIDALDEASIGREFAEIEAHPHQIQIQTQSQGGQVMITITDNGPGISASQQAQVFEHGFTTKAVGKGTGLGLAIAQQIIVEKHGGTIALASTLGVGTTFTMTLPIQG